jgi:tyrosine-protein kinase Etk/Wzc
MTEGEIIDKKNEVHPKELLFRYIRFVPWVIASLLLSLGIAWVKLRYSSPEYYVSGKILSDGTNPYGGENGKFGNIMMFSEGDNDLANEMEIIKSSSMGARVAKSLGLHMQYALKGNVRTSSLHPSDLPFYLKINNVKDSSSSFSFSISLAGVDRFKINEDSTIYFSNQQVHLPEISFQLTIKPGINFKSYENQIICTWRSERARGYELSSRVNVFKSEGSSILMIGLTTGNTKSGVDIVNQYMLEYQKASLEDKKLIAYSTLEFIDAQLDTLQIELGNIEGNLQSFREKNRIVNPEVQTSLYFNDYSETNKLLTVQEVNIRIIDYLFSYFNDNKNENRLVPSNLGITEPSLNEQIAEYNKMQLEKITRLQTTPAANPVMVELQIGINKVKEDILENLKNVRQTYLLNMQEISKKNREADASIRSMPQKERRLLEVSRKQVILQELYSFLLQKKLETAIASASTISNIKLLEPALAGGAPVSPNRKNTYIIAMFLGLGLPVGIIFLMEILNDKVKSRNDVADNTNTPILGEIGHADDNNSLIVRTNSRNYVAEQFRIIRSNLQYFLPKNEKPVILVTSSFSGEGKSFISTNLGAVLALSGKRTVILEFDIRKPKILKGLGLNERKGITNFVVGSMKINEIIRSVPDVENLYVIPCGPVPPNPSELLIDEEVGKLFESLKRQFDAIIIDSAPVGMVSDAFTLSTHANSSIYVVRHNYTLKKQIQVVEDLYSSGKLPRMSIIINDIASVGGYNSYYGYGYGYGYGKMNKSTQTGGYFDNWETTSKWKHFWKKKNK